MRTLPGIASRSASTLEAQDTGTKQQLRRQIPEQVGAEAGGGDVPGRDTRRGHRPWQCHAL